MTGSVLTGSLDRCALEDADYDIGTGLTRHNANDDKGKSSKFAVAESCIQRQN